MPAPFVDIDHETGDTTQYTSIQGAGVSVTAQAALNGTSYGLQAIMNSAANRWGEKDYTAAASRYYRVRFWFDPNGMTMNNGEIISIFETQSAAASIREQIRFGQTAGNKYIRGSIKNDASAQLNTGDYVVTDEPHLIEFLVTRASTNVAADGRLDLWIDGVLKGSVTGVDLFDLTRPTKAAIGAARGVTATTVGTIYCDELEMVDADAFDPPAGGGGDFVANWTLNVEDRASAALAAGATATPNVVDAASVAKADLTIFQVKAAWAARPTRGGIDIQIRGSVDNSAFEARPSIKYTLYPEEGNHATAVAALIVSPYPYSKITVTNGSDQSANVEIKHALKQISQAV